MDYSTIKEQVWNKGQIVFGYDADKYRQDECGAWMIFEQHGNRNSIYGWEIDHIKPVEQGGTDELSNLRPLQWENNLNKSEGRLKCKVSSQGNKNIYLF